MLQSIVKLDGKKIKNTYVHMFTDTFTIANHVNRNESESESN